MLNICSLHYIGMHFLRIYGLGHATRKTGQDYGTAFEMKEVHVIRLQSPGVRDCAFLRNSCTQGRWYATAVAPE